MIFSILVVDDETPARKELKHLIANTLDNAMIYEAACGEEALKIAQKEDIHIAFVDISMHDIDGISLAKELYKINKDIKIVFATAYDAYAVKAFELNALDYIMKPFEEDRIRQTVKKLLNDFFKGIETNASKNMTNATEITISKIPVWKDDRAILIDIKDIVYVAADERNAIIKTINGEFHAKQNLCCIEKKLKDFNFYRTHRSYIINLEYVREILPWFNNTYIVKMYKYEKDEIPVSRSQIKKFKDIFQI